MGGVAPPVDDETSPEVPYQLEIREDMPPIDSVGEGQMIPHPGFEWEKYNWN